MTVNLPQYFRRDEVAAFINPGMGAYFREKLLQGMVSVETDRSLEFRPRDRERKLISKIDAALRRIEDESYGYCEETGEPISLRRLEARPIATLSIESQERHERMERTHRDD